MSFCFVAGGVLWGLGLVGTLCGNIVAAAIGRTRERLADANAVKFTRNPAGLASALRKIAIFPQRGRIPGDVRPEMNFLFFVTGVRTLLAAHPTIRERIYRLEGIAGLEQLDRMAANPQRYLVPIATIENEQPIHPTDPLRPAAMDRLRRERGVRGFRAIFALPEEILCTSPEEQISLQESVVTELQRRTQKLVAAIPAEIREAAGDPWSARGVMLAIFTSPESRDETLANDPVLRSMVQKDRECVAKLPLETKIALMDVVLRTLRRMATSQKRVFLNQLQSWIGPKAATSLAGGVVTVTVRALLEPKPNAAPLRQSENETIPNAPPPSPSSSSPSPPPLPPHEPLQRLLAILAIYGAEQPQDALTAYLRGATILRPWLPNFPETLPRAKLARLRDLPKILTTLSKIADKERTRVLRAVLEMIVADGVVTLHEALLLRMVGAALDLPIPLLLPDSSDSQ